MLLELIRQTACRAEADYSSRHREQNGWPPAKAKRQCDAGQVADLGADISSRPLHRQILELMAAQSVSPRSQARRRCAPPKSQGQFQANAVRGDLLRIAGYVPWSP